MSLFKRTPPPPVIPAYVPPVIEAKPRAKEEGIVVQESPLSDLGIDVDALSRTGIHRAWDRFAARIKPTK